MAFMTFRVQGVRFRAGAWDSSLEQEARWMDMVLVSWWQWQYLLTGGNMSCLSQNRHHGGGGDATQAFTLQPGFRVEGSPRGEHV